MVSVIARYELLLVGSQSLLVLQDIGHLPDQSVEKCHYIGMYYGLASMGWSSYEAYVLLNQAHLPKCAIPDDLTSFVTLRYHLQGYLRCL